MQPYNIVYQTPQFTFDLGIPIHLGVLSLYSRQISPYCSRHPFSSKSTKATVPTVNRIKNNPKSQEAVAMLVPRKTRKQVPYMGCLEYRYNPFLSGCVAVHSPSLPSQQSCQPIRIAQWEHLHKTILSLILREEKWNRWQR